MTIASILMWPFDPMNNGAHSANPRITSGDGDASRKSDDHSRAEPPK
jgi:hypothetical protein